MMTSDGVYGELRIAHTCTSAPRSASYVSAGQRPLRIRSAAAVNSLVLNDQAHGLHIPVLDAFTLGA
jgi:hypothetical protein